MSIKSIIGKVKATATEFKDGFKEGYENATTERKEDPDVIVAKFKEEKTLVRRASNTVGVFIGLIVKFFRKPLVRKVCVGVGAAACVVSALANMLIVGGVLNFLLVALPFLIMGGAALYKKTGGELGHLTSAVVAFCQGMCAWWAFIGVVGNMVAGAWTLMLVCVALYLVPFMVHVHA